MIKALIILLITAFLGACAQHNPVVVRDVVITPKEVGVALPILCAIEPITTPVFELSKVSPDDSDYVFFASALREVEQRRVHQQILEAAIIGCGGLIINDDSSKESEQ